MTKRLRLGHSAFFFRPRGGGCDVHRGLLYRVDEPYVPGVKADTPVRIGTRRTVLEVTLDWAADMAELAAYLMMTSCKQFDLEEVIAVRIGNVPVAQARELAFSASGYKGFVLLLVAVHPVLQQSLFLSRSLAAECVIGFVHISVAEHL